MKSFFHYTCLQDVWRCKRSSTVSLLSVVFFRWDISVISPVMILKLAVTVFISLPFRTLRPNWLNFFSVISKTIRSMTEQIQLLGRIWTNPAVEQIQLLGRIWTNPAVDVYEKKINVSFDEQANIIMAGVVLLELQVIHWRNDLFVNGVTWVVAVWKEGNVISFSRCMSRLYTCEMFGTFACSIN